MSLTNTFKQGRDGRQLGRAWRNAGVAAVAVGVLVLGTQGVLALVSTAGVRANNAAALAECGEGNVASVSKDSFSCAD